MSVEAAGRRYALLVFLIWLPIGLLVAPMVLLMLQRGLDLPTIALVGAVAGVTTATLELPTGGLADVVGRRGVLLCAAIASLTGMVVFGLATTVAAFTVAAFLRGVARALSSGPPEAWYVDTVRTVAGPDTALVPGLARGEVAAALALTIGTVAGGLLPVAFEDASGSASALAIPVFAAAAVEVVRIVVTYTGMPEPTHPTQRVAAVLKAVPVTIADGVRLGTRDVVLIRVLLAGAGIGVALATVELLTPPWLADATDSDNGGGLAYAFVAALGFAADGVGSAASVWLMRVSGDAPRAVAASLTVSALALVALAGATTLTGHEAVVAAGGSYCLFFAALGAGAAPQAELLHRRIGPDERATVLSIQSLLLQAAGTVGAVTLGWVALHRGPALPFVIAGAVVIAMAALFVAIRPESPA